MDSPSSTVRRRAWINSSRRWSTLEEADPERSLCSLPSASITDDDVFSDGCFTGKIEDWLLGCGSVNNSQLSFDSMVKANNTDDDLSLGADALVLNSGEAPCEAGPSQRPPPNQQRGRVPSSRSGLLLPSFPLGHSLASSCPSSASTCRTTSSVSEVLDMCSEDAEETLYELGFGTDEPQAPVRIPPRFFTFPSQAQGISFRLFLDSQLRRIREEDPGLSLASRFRQVQALTAMANAFYSLYSHVSRTPLQKLAPPELSFSSPMERLDRFRSGVRSEPRSPVERLKDTVSKMCLYTGSPRGSDSTSPQPSPRKRSSLPDVVDLVLVKGKTGATKKLDLEGFNRRSRDADVGPVTGEDGSCSGWKIDTEIPGNKIHQSYKTEADENIVQPADDDRKSEVETDGHSLSPQAGRDACFTQSDTNTDEIKTVSMVTHDLICPHISEGLHQTPLCRQHTRYVETDTGTEGNDKAHEANKQAPISDPGEDDVDASLPVLDPTGSHARYCITMTSWEGDGPSCCSLNAADSCHASNVSPAQTRQGSLDGGKTQYLNPPAHRRVFSSNVEQVNSFELEEVHSAGEEEVGQSNTTRTTNSPLSTKGQHKGEVARGDSVQSDSSGYADEEVRDTELHY